MSVARDKDVQLMARLRAKARSWRASMEAANDERAGLNGLVVEAKEQGHSYKQIREETGFSIATIQMILAKAGYKEPAPEWLEEDE